MLTELVRQDQIASELANASTPGYKADRSSQAGFGDVLLANTETGATIGSFDNGVAIAATKTDLSQAPLQQTGNALDLALAGDGFFSVRTPQGVRYTRDGQFATNAQGQLVNASGFPVLDTKGQPIAVGAGGQSPEIGTDGVVKVAGKAVGTIAVASLQNPAKEGDTLFTGTAGARPKETTVVQGSLEGSGVNPADAMIDMIVSFRAFEASQHVIHAIDETLGRAIDSAASTGGS